MKLSNFFSLLLLIIMKLGMAQSFNDEKVGMANFLKRMYLATPFEGVKLVDGYDNKLFISILSLEKEKYPNSSSMMRIAMVKAQSQANVFFNGSSISSDFIIKTNEVKQNDSSTTKKTMETVETIRENSSGFVKALELLINFETSDGKRMVFIYYKELNKD